MPAGGERVCGPPFRRPPSRVHPEVISYPLSARFYTKNACLNTAHAIRHQLGPAIFLALLARDSLWIDPTTAQRIRTRAHLNQHPSGGSLPIGGRPCPASYSLTHAVAAVHDPCGDRADRTKVEDEIPDTPPRSQPLSPDQFPPDGSNWEEHLSCATSNSSPGQPKTPDSTSIAVSEHLALPVESWGTWAGTGPCVHRHGVHRRRHDPNPGELRGDRPPLPSPGLSGQGGHKPSTSSPAVGSA